MQITMNRAITATGYANDTHSTPDQCFTNTGSNGADNSNAAGQHQQLRQQHYLWVT